MCIHECTHMYLFMCIYILIYMYMYSYIYIPMNTYIYMYIQVLGDGLLTDTITIYIETFTEKDTL